MSPRSRRLAPAEQRALFRGTAYRIIGTPVVGLLGLANTAIIVRETGADVFGLVSLVGTLTLLFPFFDLGIGATVLNASSALTGPNPEPTALDVIRRGYRVLGCVAAVIVVVALGVMAGDMWGLLIGITTGPADRWAVTAAAVLFALTMPAGLGVRILIGIDRNDLAAVTLMSSSAFALMATLAIAGLQLPGIWFALSALAGVLVGHLVATVIALRLSGLGRTVFEPVGVASRGAHLLRGSGWLFVTLVGIPLGLQGGRLLLSHLSTPVQLSEYSLVSQIYGLGWSVFTTAGVAFWPIFVKRRNDPEATVRLWWSTTLVFTAVAAIGAVLLTLLGPWVADVLSGGEIRVSTSLALAFGALLVAQGFHLPAGVLLTRPNEARWQAYCIAAMAVIGLGVGAYVAGSHGAVGVVAACALGVFIGQVVPDLVRVPALVRRRAGEPE